MKKTSLLFLLAAAVLFFQSCKHAATSGLIIPKDASVVAYIDGSSLSSKLSWDEIKQSAWFKKQYESETDDYKKTLMNDPEASGVNIKSDFAFFIKKEGAGSYFLFEGKLKDASAFETFNTKGPKAKKVEKDGDLNFIRDESSAVVWNKSIFMVLSSNGSSFNGKPPFMKGMTDENPEVKLSVDTLVQIAKGLLDLSNDKLLNDDSRFTSLLKDKGDIHLWVNNQFDQVGNGMLSMLKAGDLIKGNVSATTFNFENGKISVASKSYLNKQLTDFMKSHKPEPVTADLINRIPFQDVSVAIAANISTAGMVELLKMAGLDGLANGALSKYKLTIDDIAGAFKGQFIAGVSNVTVVEKEHNVEGTQFKYKSKEPNADYFVGISVNNKATFQKFLDLGKEQLDEATKSGKVTYQLANDWFVVSNTQDIANKFLAGGDKHLPFTGRISGHPFGMYIDLQKIASIRKMMPMADTTSKPVWQDVVITGGEFKDDAVVMNVEVNLFDKSTNSLKQLFNYGSNIFKGFADREEMFNKDQVEMEPPVDSTSTVITPTLPLPKKQKQDSRKH